MHALCPSIRQAATVLAGVMVLFAGAGNAQAQGVRESIALPPGASACPCGGGVRLNATALMAELANRTVCASLGSERWTEFHRADSRTGGTLISYRKGPNDPIDPTQESGRWLIEGGTRSEPVVTYVYGEQRYSYAVCKDGAQVHLCGSGKTSRNIAGATMRNGQTACN
jgi:hypothetical protein